MFGKNKYSRRGFHPLKILFFGVVAVVFVFVFSGIVMFLWNAILPDTVGVKPLTFWKAMGLLILCKILFGGFGGRGKKWANKKNHWKNKWKNMSEEDREKIKSRWKNRCNPKDEL